MAPGACRLSAAPARAGRHDRQIQKVPTVAADKKIRISTMRQMEKALAHAVAMLAGNDQLMQLAALNPVFAMEEAGFEFTDDLRASIERRVRFHPDVYARMETLVGEIRATAGRPVDVDSAEDLDRLLFSELKLVRPATTLRQQLAPAHHALLASEHVTERVPPQLGWTPKLTDPLEELRGAHPVMEALLEYRRHDASTPRLAARELYEKVRRGEVKLPIKNLRATIQPHPPGH